MVTLEVVVMDTRTVSHMEAVTVVLRTVTVAVEDTAEAEEALAVQGATRCPI